MATTTDSTGSAPRYAEDDKLGPLGAKASSLYDPTALRKVLLADLGKAVAKAREAAHETDLGTGVHEARKALRRARAILSMFSAALPKSEYRAVRRALQQARRSLSAARDQAVAPETFAGIELSDEDRATAQKVLANAAASLPPAEDLKKLLADATASAIAQGEALEAALPQQLSWSEVVAGIQNIYSEARDARQSSKRSKRWFHTWRRRSKELVYQLELVAEHAGKRMVAIHDELASVVETLSPAVDVVMLREFVSIHGQGIPADAIEHLEAAIDKQGDELMKTARAAGKDAFEAKDKRFAKRLIKSAKRDLTPPDDNDLNDDD